MTARWHVETTEQFDRQFKKLDRAVQRRVLSYREDVESLEHPRQRGTGLTANHSGVWRYRVGDYRVLVQILDDTLVILAENVDREFGRRMPLVAKSFDIAPSVEIPTLAETSVGTAIGHTAGQSAALPIARAKAALRSPGSLAPPQPERADDPPVPASEPREALMTTVLIFHEVDNVEHWLSSPRRDEVFGPLGISIQTFIDPTNDYRVGLIVDVPDLDVFQRVMASETVAEAMQFDGVRPETVVMMVES